MTKLLTILNCLMLAFYCSAETKTTSNKSTNLFKAKELGRLNSNLLNAPKTIKKSSEIPKANITAFKNSIEPVFKKNCIACHGPKKVKGKFRIDQLDPDLLNGPHINEWLEVYEVLSNSEMPPDDEPDYHLGDKERNAVISWLGEEMNKASEVRRNEGGHSSFRRLAKYEYNNALQDILGLPYDYSSELPTETVSEDGFLNSSEHLNMTAMQFETYRSIGLKALKKATVIGQQPEKVIYSISMENEMKDLISSIKRGKEKAKNSKDGKKYRGPEIHNIKDKDFFNKTAQTHVFNSKTGNAIPVRNRTYKPVKNNELSANSQNNTALVLHANHSFVLNLGNHLPDTGTMRVRIRTARTTHKEHEYSSLRLLFGAHTSNNANFTVTASKEDIAVTAPLNKPEYIEFDIPLSEIPRNPFRKNKTNFPRRDELLTIQNISNAGYHHKKGNLDVHIDHIEIISPVYKSWPPQSHKTIFFNSKNNNNEQAYSQEIIKRFIARAWRRPVHDDELQRYANYFNDIRPDFDNFEEAMLEVLSTVLASPEFLYVIQKNSEKSQTVNNTELANRLALFLWSSIPDSELIKLAQRGHLKDPEVLNRQVERMLKDSRAQRFSKSFVSQWLGLKALDHVLIDKKVSRNFNQTLKPAMLQEPVAYFDEVLKNNRSIIDFIHSDYLVINETLARHYGIPGVFGPHFQKVKISPKVQRGGLLTGAAILTMNSDGKDSHPIKRGVWLLEHILNDPPPPPPPNVPEVDLTDPNILKMTVKERIENHRDHAACRSCHTKIDPWGVAFENFDTLGKFRTKIKGTQDVDASSTLFNKQELAGIDGLKHYLLNDRQDQFTRALVHKMTAFSLGRPLTFSDRSHIDDITVKLRQKGDGLKDLVSLIVNSKIFQSK